MLQREPLLLECFEDALNFESLDDESSSKRFSFALLQKLRQRYSIQSRSKSNPWTTGQGSGSRRNSILGQEMDLTSFRNFMQEHFKCPVDAMHQVDLVFHAFDADNSVRLMALPRPA